MPSWVCHISGLVVGVIIAVCIISVIVGVVGMGLTLCVVQWWWQ